MFKTENVLCTHVISNRVPSEKTENGENYECYTKGNGNENTSKELAQTVKNKKFDEKKTTTNIKKSSPILMKKLLSG